MRITHSPLVLALAGLVAFSPLAAAQDDGQQPKSDTEVPAGQAGAFGPRAGANGQPPQGQAQGPKITTIATHGSWAVQCTELAPEQGGKSCGMIQNSKNEKDQRLALSVVVSRVKRDGKAITFMRVIAPIGVYLPTGIPVEIDGAALPSRLPFSRCIPQMCEGMAEASAETLSKFKKGTAATFYLYIQAGKGVPMKVSLDGFGAALGELEKL